MVRNVYRDYSVDKIIYFGIQNIILGNCESDLF